MTDLRIGDDIFNVMVEGDGTKPAVMLSHSLGADLSMWDAQVPALLEHFRVVRYDTRGHGGSAATDAAVSIARLGRDALAILDALEIDRVHFIGLSMGGVIGQWLLLNAPDRLDRAVLANTAAKLGDPDGWNQRIVAMLAGDTDATADATMDRWFSATFADAAPDRVAAIDAVLRATDPRGYAACCAALRDMDLRQELLDRATIGDANVLLITGTDDPVITDADTAFLTRAFATARHVALEARHISNIEAEASFTAAIVEFLTAKSVRRRTPASARVTKPTPTIRRPSKSRSTAARVPLKVAAAPVVVAGTTAAKPTAPRRKTAARPAGRQTATSATIRPKTTRALAAKSPRKTTAAPAKPVSAARAGTGTSSRAPSRTAVGKASTLKTGTAKARTTKTRAVTAKATPRAVPAKTTATKSGSAKASAGTTVAGRRKPPTLSARGTVTARTAAKPAPKKTTVKTTKTKPKSTTAASGRTAASKTARKPTAIKAAVATRGIAKTPAKTPARSKAKATPRANIAAKAKVPTKDKTTATTKPKSAPAKGTAARRKPAAAKPRRPTGRRTP